MINKTVLEFERNEAGSNEGLGDPGVETFNNTPYSSAAKESGQNSKDAMSKGPVKMAFLLHKIKAEQLPLHNSLLETVNHCLNRKDVTENSDSKEKDFFTNARMILNRAEIPVLEISDSNTTGLVGPAIDGKPFYSLLKGAGVSDKPSITSNGSFGIGKDASFAISDLRTVLYSTLYKDAFTGTESFLAQGKVKLASHIDSQGVPRKRTAWWGYSGFQAIDKHSDVPYWMKRSEIGTSVFSIGFREEELWQHRMIAALLTTFFIAIVDKEMEFNVDNTISITAETISQYFEDPEVAAAAVESGSKEEFEFSKSLYRCYVSSDSVNYDKEISASGDGSIGNFQIRVLKQKGLPKRVGFVRNGIFITDNLKNFNHPFRVFPRYSDFIALVSPLNSKGSALLKTLENPSHDEFSANRIINEEKRSAALALMKELGRTIRETIKNYTRSKPNKVEALNELAETFPFSTLNAEEGDLNEHSPTILKYEPPRKTKKKKKKKKSNVSVKSQTITHDTNEPIEPSEQAIPQEPKEPQEPKPSPEGYKCLDVGKKLNLIDQRNISKSKDRRRVLFNVNKSRFALLKIEATGLAQNTKIFIQDATIGRVINGEIQMNMEAGHRISLDIYFDEDYSGPIEISCTILGEFK